MNFQSAISFLVFYIFWLFLQIYIDKGLLFKVTEPFFWKKVEFEILLKNEIYLWKIKEKSVNFTQKLLISKKRETNLKKGSVTLLQPVFWTTCRKKIENRLENNKKIGTFVLKFSEKKKKNFENLFF